MKRLFKILLGCGIGFALVGIPLFVSGSLRDTTFRVATELPAIFYYFRLRSPMVNRDFSLAARYLAMQLDLVEGFAQGRNTMIPGLLANTKFVLDQAVFSDDFSALQPYLKRLSLYQKDLFPAHIWLAEAILATEPTKVFEHTTAARRLIPTDERPYRLAIEAALKTGETERIGMICKQYQDAKLGAYHFYEHNTLFSGSGLNKFGLEVTGKEGNTQLVTHSGPILGKQIPYQFHLNTPIPIHSLRFHFATPPGLLIKIESIDFYLEGIWKSKLSRDQYVVASRNGFQTGDGVVTTSRKSELLAIYPNDFKAVKADQLNVSLTVSRLNLLDHSACKREK
jgi:hypothetical protein